jgi:hypothetical protein
MLHTKICHHPSLFEQSEMSQGIGEVDVGRPEIRD